MIDLSSFSIIAVVLIFLLAATLVWVAGSRLSAIADDFSEKTGVGQAFVGLLLLGGITSLPEVATTITASLKGHAGMAVNNILGGVSMQVTILAVVDFWQQKKPLSSLSTDIIVIMQGVFLMIMLALVASFMLIKTGLVFHIGLDSLSIFLVFLFGLYFMHKYSSYAWFSYRKGEPETVRNGMGGLEQQVNSLSQSTVAQDADKTNMTIQRYFNKKGLPLLLWSLLILVAGYFVISTSEVIADASGLSGNFIGLVLVAITTSLPEISTTLGAIKLNRFDMALSNIFGANLFNVALIFLADLFFVKGAVLQAVGSLSIIAAMLGIILTAIYVLGILAKSKKQVMGIGYDSLIIIITYLSGILLLYFLDD
jgi:cation:H+ antiporter